MLLTFYAFLIVVICVIGFGRNSQNEVDNHLLSFDNTTIMRGVAILMVVIHHLSLWFGTNVLTSWGGGGVAIFMILSGYGLTMSYQKSGVKRFWWKRFTGIPPRSVCSTRWSVCFSWLPPIISGLNGVPFLI